MFLCALCYSSMNPFSEGFAAPKSEGRQRFAESDEDWGITESALMNKKSLLLVCGTLWTQTCSSASKFDTALCMADSGHHFGFIFTVNAHLKGVMKYTLHVSQGLCAVAADIIKLP